MGIIQEDRFDAPQPEVTKTEYGAEYVKASTEKPVFESPTVTDEAPSAEDVKEQPSVPATESPVVNSDVKPSVKASDRPRRKTGRPKKVK